MVVIVLNVWKYCIKSHGRSKEKMAYGVLLREEDSVGREKVEEKGEREE